jgi:hypothetical protein
MAGARMRRKRLYISIGLVAGFVLLVLVGLVAMVKSDPAFYAQSDMPADSHRRELSDGAKHQYSEILSILSKDSWDVGFTADQLNAYFQEDYFQQGGDDNLPDGFHNPRVKIQDGKMRVGVRYGSGLFSTVMSLEVKAWKVQGQINTLAVEIISLQAGSLPLSTSVILDDISEAVRRWNIEITWFRHDGHPVAILRFQADQSRPTFQFDSVDMNNGKLTVWGRSTDLAAPPPR